MVKTKYDGLGMNIDVEPGWISQELKGKTDCFLGKVPEEKRAQCMDYKSIDSLVREHNAANKDSIRAFYWDDKGNIIFGHVFKDSDVFSPDQSYTLAAQGLLIPGHKISNMQMVREYSAGKKALPVVSRQVPVLQILNCFDGRLDESLTDYLKGLSMDDRYSQFGMYFGKEAHDPLLKLHYVVDRQHLKTFQNQFKETVREKDLSNL
jgi:hypothetical protein